MKLTRTTIATALLLSIVGLLGEQTSAVASSESLTPERANQLSRDLLPRSPSQEFFEQGRQRIERELLLLNQRQNASSTEPVLKINADTQAEIDRLAEPQRSNFQ